MCDGVPHVHDVAQRAVAVRRGESCRGRESSQDECDETVDFHESVFLDGGVPVGRFYINTTAAAAAGQANFSLFPEGAAAGGVLSIIY